METASHSGSSNVSRESKTLRTRPTLLQDTHSPQSRMKHFINHWTLATVVTELDLEGGSGLERIWSNLWYQAKSTVSISLRYLPVLNCHSHPDSLRIQTGHRSLNILGSHIKLEMMIIPTPLWWKICKSSLKLIVTMPYADFAF